MCEFAVTFVEHKLLTNRTVDMAERAVQMFCAYLPGSVAEKCEKFVDDYGDQLIRLIMEEEMSPEEVCTQLEACQGQKRKQIGGDEGTKMFGRQDGVQILPSIIE